MDKTMNVEPKTIAQIKTRKLANGQKVTTVKSKPRKKRKKLFKKIITTGLKLSPMAVMAKAGAKATQRLKGKPKKTVGEASIAFLLPLMPAMKKGLEQKGLTSKYLSNNQVIEKFYNLYISKKADPASKYDELKENEFANHYLFNQDYDTFDSDNVVGMSDAQTIINVGKGIVSGFKKWKEKKKAAKAAKKNPTTVMPKEEVVLANEADKVVKKLEAEAKNETPVNKKSMTKYLVIAGVLAIATILFLKFRK